MKHNYGHAEVGEKVMHPKLLHHEAGRDLNSEKGCFD